MLFQNLRLFGYSVVAIGIVTLTPHFMGAAVAAPVHGHVTKGRCPITCKSLGIPKDKCREWRDNGLCYVEDLTRPRRLPPPPQKQPPKVEPTPTPFTSVVRPPSSIPNNPTGPRPGYGHIKPMPRPSEEWTPGPQWPVEPGGPSRGDAQAACFRKGHMSRPRIDIYRIKKTGNIFGSKYKVRGVIEGVCLVEAGYFEEGRREETIPVFTTPEFRRFEFEVKVRAESDRSPEIRAYNIQGERDIYEVGTDEFDSDDRSDGYWGSDNRRPSDSGWRW